METSKVELTFRCPVKWKDLPAAENGRYCSSCKKTLKDLSGSSPEEIASASETFDCGNFYVSQLDRPFNDKRDVLVSYYRKIKKSNSKKVILFFIMALMFLTGCRSRRTVCGGFSYKPADTTPARAITKI